MAISVISMPSKNLMREYLKKGIWGDEYRPGHPLHNWVRYWVKPGEEIDYLYLKEHLAESEKGRADIMFSPWMIIQGQLSLNGEEWYKRDIMSGKLNAKMLEEKLPQDKYPRLMKFLELASSRANMWLLPKASMQARGFYPMTQFFGSADGLGTWLGDGCVGGCADQMTCTLSVLYLDEGLIDRELFAKENCLRCFFEDGVADFGHLKAVEGFGVDFQRFNSSQAFLDAYIEYAIARIEEREQELQMAEENGWETE